MARKVVWLVGAGLILLMLGGLVLTSKPWNAGWWPGVSEASAVAGPCVVLAEPAERLTPGKTPASSPYDRPGRTACTAGEVTDEASLRLAYEREEWSFIRHPESGVTAAHNRLASRVGTDTGTWKPVSGLGDEAYRKDSRGTSQIRARKGNVVVDVSYSDSNGKADLPVQAERVARAALAEIVF
ncbi:MULTISPECIES: hypothetical protein [unclassified Streptomyces]|uniref:hypothetical protein n=1 Tax=unclassified Streptomyces TaxID=2593676 RepID=UPI000DC7D269|nr:MULTISPECIES: hypothetical protein [unclassified Streptomyces]AWZ08263.1 hypothetical protein DRB89_30860 [Streptomyces sp. ICC4]AWZ16078.1 hypothetical protein DRB96_31815 [Streptomyces sp. ICC1]